MALGAPTWTLRGRKGTIFSFKADIPAAEKTEKCLNCHNKESANFVFKSSEHMKGSVTCSDCHEVHSAMGKDMLLSNEGYKLCLKCHREIEPKILLNERHRITEGIVKCVDCHKNHEPSTRSQLGGFNQQTCYKCHTDKQGPFIYEHGAVRTEGCVACHDPHGSVNRHMLSHQSHRGALFFLPRGRSLFPYPVQPGHQLHKLPLVDPRISTRSFLS